MIHRVSILNKAVAHVYHIFVKSTNNARGGIPSEEELKSFNRQILPILSGCIGCDENRSTINLLFIGNSISEHPIIEDMLPCRELRGMMATKPEYDYIHQLCAMIEEKNDVNVRWKTINVAEVFERDFMKATFPKEIFDQVEIQDLDFVIFQLGENVSENAICDSSIFEEAYLKILSMFSHSIRLLSIPFWPNKKKQYIMTQIAIKSNSYLVDLSHLGNGTDLENFAESQKKYKTPGVGVHPGNIGMKHIAECYYAIINAILSTKCKS